MYTKKRPVKKTPRPYQIEQINALREDQRKNKNTFCQNATGTGKCFGKNTEILLHNGTVKKVQDIVIGDNLMGDDGEPRKVISTCSGYEMLYRIIPIKGKPYIVNESHILSLKRTNERNIKINPRDFRNGEIVNISLKEYFKTNKCFKHIHKGYRKGVEFNEKYINKNLPIDPYFLGIWIGDGHSRNPTITTMDSEIIKYIYEQARKIRYFIRVERAGGKSNSYHITHGYRYKSNIITKKLKLLNVFRNKHIPIEYLIQTRENRLKLLAGLLDTDGYFCENYYEYVTKLKILKDNVLFLSRSLGLAAYYSKKIVNGKSYYRISLSGNLDCIPCKIKRKIASKRMQKKDVLVTGIKVKKYKYGQYFGFEIEGNNRLFLLSDFTVVHNTVIVSHIVAMAIENAKKYKRDIRIGFMTPRLELIGQAEDHFYNNDIQYCLINAKNKSNKAFNTNIISQQTLVRHLKKMLPDEIWDLFLIDEAHLAIKTQKMIVDICNEKRRSIGKSDMNVIGFSATPERADGIGLHKSGGGIYDSIVDSKSIPWYIAHGYLTQIEYFKPNPPAGLEKLGYTGTEVNTKQWDDWKKKNRIYGSIVDHYRKLGCVEKKSISLPNSPIIQINSHYNKGRPAVGFCHSVQEAYEMADAFRKAGFNFQCIEGSMDYKERKMLNDALTRGELDGLTSCDLLLYGWDCPRIEYAFDMKKTRSFTYQMQKMGRGMRPYEERDEKGNVIFRKEDFIFCDHVDNFLIHNIDGHLPQELETIDWNFYGAEKKVRKPGNVFIACPYLKYKQCSKKTCTGCKYLPEGEDAGKSKPDIIIINSNLIKHESKTAPVPVVIHDKKEFADQISAAIDECNAKPDDISRPVEKLLKVAEAMNYNYMWVYYTLAKGKLAKQSTLLYEIAKQKGWDIWGVKKYYIPIIEEFHKKNRCADISEKLRNNKIMKWTYCHEQRCVKCKKICPDCNNVVIGDMNIHKQECHAEEFKLVAY